MDIVRIAAIALISAVLSLLVRQYKPEYAMLVQLGGAAVIAVSVLALLPALLESSDSLLSFAGVDGKWLMLLIKALGIAIVTELSADVCRDNGSSALAGMVELAGKALILLLCIPLLRAVAEIAVGLING